ncbi:hypothetical protein WN51_11781 [Melipona quadrifasciata]|uniref:Uncharacterized protein n=1 Tax=Melipona quadrifasciata TaxID=166423 RepID=A0A0M9A3N4_9HYME|nr:hypothetical protein WN51_11781 [Melipona quadrifasciata]
MNRGISIDEGLSHGPVTPVRAPFNMCGVKHDRCTISGDAAGANATANDGTVKRPGILHVAAVNDARNAGQFVIGEDSEEPPNHRARFPSRALAFLPRGFRND